MDEVIILDEFNGFGWIWMDLDVLFPSFFIPKSPFIVFVGFLL